MVLPLILGGISAIAGISSANKAAKAQTSAANSQLELGNQQLDENRRQFDQTMARNETIYNDQVNRLAPFANNNSQQALLFEMGLGGAPEGYQAYQDPAAYQREAFQREDFQTSPGYQFAVNEGQRAIEGSAAARGNLLSGRTLQDLQTQRMGIADQEFGQFQARQDALQQNHVARQDALALQSQGRSDILRDSALNRLAGLAGSSQSAAAGQAQYGGQFGAAAQGASSAFTANNANANAFMGNALANLGDAQAAGSIATGNALSNGLNTGAGIWAYQNALAG